MIYLSVLGYLIGSIPFGLILTKLAGYGDIRKIGSGNIGATNVLRTGNKKLAALTLLLDGGKGAVIPAFIMNITFTNEVTEADRMAYMAAAGLFAIIGHMFPVWLKFKGGKGVATTLGTYLVLAPWVGAISCVIWLAMAFLFRYSSLAALVAIAAAPFAAHFVYGNPALDAVCGVIAALVWFKHRANIRRLVKGEEPKIGKKNK